MFVHTAEKIKKLKQLRREGYSIEELVHELGMPKTTVWHHVQDVKLNSHYLKILRSKQGGSKNRSLKEWSFAREHSRQLIGHFSRIEKFLVAVALYWGEGSKKDFSLSNTDPDLIVTFIRCLEEFGVKRDDLKISVRIYEDLDYKKAVNFWLKTTGVKNIHSVDVLKGRKKGKLLYGMCRIRLKKGGYMLKLFKSIREIIVGHCSPL